MCKIQLNREGLLARDGGEGKVAKGRGKGGGERAPVVNQNSFR